MFNNIDPYQQLQDLQIVINSLQSDKMQLALAINHQAEALKLVNQRLAQQTRALQLQEQQIYELQSQIRSICQLKTV
jgi:hypothetical protein